MSAGKRNVAEWRKAAWRSGNSHDWMLYCPGPRTMAATPAGRRTSKQGDTDMVEWTENQREHVARQFNTVARGWWRKEGMGGEDGSPLWPECMKCHRLRTLVRAEAEGTPGPQPMWRCVRCGAVMSQDDVRDYQTGLLLSVTETECPPLVLTLLARCARMLFLASRGDAPTPEDAGDASRHAARVLDQFHVDEDWIHLTDQRESLLPDDPICSDAIGPHPV